MSVSLPCRAASTLHAHSQPCRAHAACRSVLPKGAALRCVHARIPVAWQLTEGSTISLPRATLTGTT
eukprot:4243728-Alexandrium_andersonii.AAC.1